MDYPGSPSLLLHAQGNDNSTSIVDSSLASLGQKSFSAVGGAKISTAQKKYGSSSFYFSGASECLLQAGSYYSSLSFGTGDFFLGTWVYLTSIPGGGSDNDMAIYTNGLSGSGYLLFYIENSTAKPTIWNGYVNVASTIAIPVNTWTWITFERVYGVLYIFVGGQLGYSGVYSFDNNSTSAIMIGGVSGWRRVLRGYLQDLVVVKGVGLHQSSYDPPTALLDDPEIINAQSTKNLMIGSDIYDGGNYHIPLNVDELGLAGSYRTRLYDKYSGRLVREQWSGADGVVDFQNLAYREKGYYATAHDHTEPLKEAAIADFLTPELMTA